MDRTHRVKLNTAGGVVDRFKIKIMELNALGKNMKNHSLVVGELPVNSRIEGLLGLDFIQDSVLKIDMQKGRITIQDSRKWFW